MEEQGGLAQILGDVLGNFILPHLQALAQLHHHLVPLVPAQGGQQTDQGLSGGVPDDHPLRYLDQVGEVGGDVQDMVLHPGLHLVPEQLYTGDLHHPGGGGFQVVQKDLAGDV